MITAALMTSAATLSPAKTGRAKVDFRQPRSQQGGKQRPRGTSEKRADGP